MVLTGTDTQGEALRTNLEFLMNRTQTLLHF
jgi:hypothetical protein